MNVPHAANTFAMAINRPLSQLRLRIRAYLALEATVELVAAFIGGGLVQLALDLWLRFSIDQRALLNSVITLFWFWVIYRGFFRRLSVSLEDRVLASRIDAAHPELHDQLTTAVEFAESMRTSRDGALPGNASVGLVNGLLADMDTAIQRFSFLDILDHVRARRRLIELSILIGVTVLAFVLPFTQQTMLTWFQRNWLVQDVSWPQRTHIVPIGYDENRSRRLPRGDELEIAAAVDGPMPSRATLVWWTPSGRSGKESMTIEGGARLLSSLGPLTENLRFRISGADERTSEYLVEAVETPQVIRTEAIITPPAYTGSAPVTIEQQTVLEVLSGSTLTIRATLNKPVATVQFVGSGGLIVPCTLFETGRDRASAMSPMAEMIWPTPASGTYRLELEDRDGLKDRNPIRFTIKLVPDKPPVVKMEAIGVGELVTPGAELMLRLEFEDPYGLATATVQLSKGDGTPIVRTFSDFAEGSRRFLATISIAVAAMDAAPGDRLKVMPEATDLDPAGPNVGRAAPLELRVVSQEDFLADLARRELDLRREFEQLLSSQKTLQDSFARLRGELIGERPATAVAQRLAGLARQQTTHASRCLTIAQRFEQILAEMRTNRVSRISDERRISERIIVPLQALARDAMPATTVVLTALREQLTPEAVDAATTSQEEVLRLMRGVLANMLQWEGYREAVDLLQEIIDEQGQIHDETLQAIERQLNEILELEEKP